MANGYTLQESRFNPQTLALDAPTGAGISAETFETPIWRLPYETQQHLAASRVLGSGYMDRPGASQYVQEASDPLRGKYLAQMAGTAGFDIGDQGSYAQWLGGTGQFAGQGTQFGTLGGYGRQAAGIPAGWQNLLHAARGLSGQYAGDGSLGAEYDPYVATLQEGGGEAARQLAALATYNPRAGSTLGGIRQRALERAQTRFFTDRPGTSSIDWLAYLTDPASGMSGYVDPRFMYGGGTLPPTANPTAQTQTVNPVAQTAVAPTTSLIQPAGQITNTTFLQPTGQGANIQPLNVPRSVADVVAQNTRESTGFVPRERMPVGAALTIGADGVQRWTDPNAPLGIDEQGYDERGMKVSDVYSTPVDEIVDVSQTAPPLSAEELQRRWDEKQAAAMASFPMQPQGAPQYPGAAPLPVDTTGLTPEATNAFANAMNFGDDTVDTTVVPTAGQVDPGTGARLWQERFGADATRARLGLTPTPTTPAAPVVPPTVPNVNLTQEGFDDWRIKEGLMPAPMDIAERVKASAAQIPGILNRPTALQAKNVELGRRQGQAILDRQRDRTPAEIAAEGGIGVVGTPSSPFVSLADQRAASPDVDVDAFISGLAGPTGPTPPAAVGDEMSTIADLMDMGMTMDEAMAEVSRRGMGISAFGRPAPAPTAGPAFTPDPMQVAGGGMMPLGPSAVSTPSAIDFEHRMTPPVIIDQFNPRPPPFWPTFGPLFEQPEQYDLQYQYGLDPAAYSGYGPV